jgi:hypothetical protein
MDGVSSSEELVTVWPPAAHEPHAFIVMGNCCSLGPSLSWVDGTCFASRGLDISQGGLQIMQTDCYKTFLFLQFGLFFWSFLSHGGHGFRPQCIPLARSVLNMLASFDPPASWNRILNPVMSLIFSSLSLSFLTNNFFQFYPECSSFISEDFFLLSTITDFVFHK